MQPHLRCNKKIGNIQIVIGKVATTHNENNIQETKTQIE
jgi:hypothetical protein